MSRATRLFIEALKPRKRFVLAKDGETRSDGARKLKCEYHDVDFGMLTESGKLVPWCKGGLAVWVRNPPWNVPEAEERKP